ncbi:PIN domain-containing protein [Leptolyngbya cf. ectocarpi LEGE 11479]|uniref:PIN domain-containing protein n=1 Tax=Leptolyngbya cf. ectocarpi LEGE 11479 TaxID=1828722 RepID=A0A929FC98_LEPEC|nr:PIN domain-containing protein [Leptolyngbya ectocarpi]MBE9069353.1 PIN domain-containing protein [Leptolyngbya cf. ectocarpi LEGE 11479]
MSQNWRIYLDACCLNRPFDDQNQPRIALEAQAILTILRKCQSAQWQLITSTALDVELNQTPDLERLSNVKTILTIARVKVLSSQILENRVRELQQLGFTGYDAAHLASAEQGHADVFLSTDDRLIKRAKRHFRLIQITVDNPVPWLMQST